MLLAYIDEIGEPGAFVSRDHHRYNTSPAFGYAGFVVPEDHARDFGAAFVKAKRHLFATELKTVEHPGRWERKGADLFRQRTWELFPQQIRVFGGLVNTLRRYGGALVYYADEKPIGTPRQTNLDTAARETAAMQETLNRVARHSESQQMNVMVIIDQINEKTRTERLPKMYAHILGRGGEHREMRRIIEPPMHVDSHLSANIQYADWVAACVTRGIERQLIESAPFEWIATAGPLGALRGAFTHESKLHFHHRSIDDLNHSHLFDVRRPMFSSATGASVGARLDPRMIERMRAAADRTGRR